MHTKIKLFALALLFFIQTAGIAQRQKVIFDCDLGDDIDDAFAIAMLLCHQDKFEIMGISTCYGRTNDRAQLALKMLYDTGNEQIPVYLGRNTSASDERANWYAEQYYFSKGFTKIAPQSKSAADFISESLEKYPGEIIIITVGPVMNMADVLQKNPNSLKKAKAIYSMFGSFYIGYNTSPSIDAEWNVRVDPKAAQAFVNSGANITYAGLDVTAMIKLDKANRDLLLMRQSPLTNMLCSLYTLWGHETPTLFDSAAIGMILYPELFKTEKVHLTVNEKGYTLVDKQLASNATIGVYINTQAFIKKLMTSLLQQNFSR